METIKKKKKKNKTELPRNNQQRRTKTQISFDSRHFQMDAKFDGIFDNFKSKLLNYMVWQWQNTIWPVDRRQHEKIVCEMLDEFKANIQNHVHQKCQGIQQASEDRHRIEISKWQTDNTALDKQLKLMLGQCRPEPSASLGMIKTDMLDGHLGGSVERAFICREPQCNKMFSSQQLLDAHIKKHSERTFVCPVSGCGKAFPWRHNLKQHIVFHTGERSFACNESGCDKKFYTKSNLKQHERIHSGKLCPTHTHTVFDC